MPSMLAGPTFFALSLSPLIAAPCIHNQPEFITHCHKWQIYRPGKYTINWPNEPWKFYFVCCSFFSVIVGVAVAEWRTKVYTNTQCCSILRRIHILFNYFHLHASHSLHVWVRACVYETTTSPHLNWPFHLVYSLSRSLTHSHTLFLILYERTFIRFFSASNDVYC